jgi:dTDP-4-dehydrorhamnose 3,5-epimerase
MEVRPTSLPQVVEILPKRHGDSRGYVSETFRADFFAKNVSSLTFVQENQSLSQSAGTIRGLHFQSQPHAQGKLVRCVAGAIFDVAVDVRHDSPQYGRWTAVSLSAELGNQLWIPPGFLHGFCTLASDCLVSYKVTDYYSAENDGGVRWDDPDIGIAWPEIADTATLSAKDARQPSLRDLPPLFTFEAS